MGYTLRGNRSFNEQLCRFVLTIDQSYFDVGCEYIYLYFLNRLLFVNATDLFESPSRQVKVLLELADIERGSSIINDLHLLHF